MKIARSFALMIVSLLTCNYLIADEIRHLASFVNEDELVSVDYRPTADGTQLIFTAFDDRLQPTKKKELLIKGIIGKYCSATPLYSSDNTKHLILINVMINDKFGSEFTTVGVTSNFALRYRYVSSVTMFGFKSPDESFLSKDTAQYLPVITGYARCAFAADGKFYYFHSADWYDEHGRPLTLGHKSKYNSALYGYKQYNGGIPKLWKMDVEEERILSFRSFAFGNIGILFTSYFVGNDKAKNNEICEGRVRMFDGETGRILWDVKLPAKPKAEYFLADLTYDSISGNTWLALNTVDCEKNVNLKKDGPTRSSFGVVKITKAGEVSSNFTELNWTASKLSFDNNRVPVMLVRNIAVLRNGDLQIAGTFGFWRESLDADGSTQISATMTFAHVGMSVILFNPDLTIKQTNQYAFGPIPSDKHIVRTGEAWLARDLSSRVVLYEGDGTADQAYWNPKTETLILLQSSPYHEMGKHDIYALKLVSGQQKYFKTIGQCTADNAPALVFFAAGENVTKIYHARFGENISPNSLFEVTE